ncbi:MAG: thiamine-phosphate kinase [Sphingomonadales bacterium]
MDEFELIAEIFAPLAPADAPAFGLLSDTANWQPGEGQTVILTKDMLVEGRHFLAGDDAGLIARKLLRVNLSDLAAAGAEPRGYLLGLGLKGSPDRKWLQAFSKGLLEDQKHFGLELWGGDTVAAPALVLSLTAIGTAPEGSALSRLGAVAGDHLYVSGTIGDAALGLLAAQGKAPRDSHFERRLSLPEPRLQLGRGLRGLARAVVDISDGLLADVGHLAAASGLGAIIERDRVPLSKPAERLLIENSNTWQAILAGGDDYELAFAAPPGAAGKLEALSRALGLPLTRIGSLREGEGVRVLDGDGGLVSLEKTGYSHFPSGNDQGV